MTRHGLLTTSMCLLLSWSFFGQTSGAHAQARPLKAPQAGYGFVAAEFMTTEQVQAQLPLLATYGVGLILNWPSSDISASSARLALVQRAEQLGIEVRPWITLPFEQGYWPGATNAREFDRAARQLIDTWLAAGLKPTMLEVDMEIPFARALKFSELAAKFDTDALVAFLKQGIDRAEYAEATRIYRGLADYAHLRGFRVELSTLAPVLDDYADGDDGLRQAFNIPVDNIPWDSVLIQVYRTLNDFVLEGVAGKTGPYFVFDYAARARARFGTRAGVCVGLTDPGDFSPTAPVYSNGNKLREDIDAASLAGIARKQIALYSLRGIGAHPPVTQWFPQRSTLLFPPLPDAASLLARTSSIVLDSRL